MKQSIIILFAVCMLTACNKYLDVAPRGYTLLNTTDDYNQWLDQRSLMGGVNDISGLNSLADNVDQLTVLKGSTSPGDLVYTWAPQFNLDVTLRPPFWSDHYSNIYLFNAVINGVMGASGGSTEQKQQLYAEGLLGRAFEYVYLLNLYGKVYDPATAGQDLSVPFVTSTDISRNVPKRATVGQLYQQIVTDLNAAIANLPDNNSRNRYRGSKAAAYSVLARASLYARNYAEAGRNAQLALGSDPTLALVNYNQTTNLPDVMVSRECIYSRGGFAVDDIFLPPRPFMTPDFMSLFGPNDLRLREFYGLIDPTTGLPTQNYSDLTKRGTIVFNSNTFSYAFNVINAGTSVAEMKLIVAESAARSGNLTNALQQLNELRRTRLQVAGNADLQSSDPAVVLDWVLRERRLEFPFNGIRWFDMRRLDKEGRMPAVKRYYGDGTLLATLLPNSNAYTLQVPDYVLRFNPSMPQNVR